MTKFAEGCRMLVLTRKLGQSIQIGNGTKLTVVAIQGQQIRLGIDAPRSVPILRGELDERPPVTTKPDPRGADR
jgi:carbon storage regulator